VEYDQAICFQGKEGRQKGNEKKKLMTDRGKGKREREKGIKICHLRGEEKEKKEKRRNAHQPLTPPLTGRVDVRYVPKPLAPN